MPLTEAENPHVAQLYGWIEAQEDDLAMLQQFLRTASDGWELALASARNLFAEADLHADEVGGDFAGEAHRLGVAVSEVHEVLREHFETEPFDGAADCRRDAPPAGRRHVRRARAGRAPRRPGAGVRAHRRRHGRRHGPSACTATCTSARPCAPRRAGSWSTSRASRPSRSPSVGSPDSPWRDVAGMLRSFDYAAQSVVKDLYDADEPGPQITYRAKEWVDRNRAAFLEGYVEARIEGGGGPLSADEQALIDAYEADKAVYEVLYEARNRPTWLDIPLGAIERIGAAR